jgi:tRNA/rRNA methyltransferase
MPVGEQEKTGLAIILVEPQMGENIGMVARAMMNFELSDLRLVQPRDGWPNPKAVSPAVGAKCVLDEARVFDDVAGAVADLDLVYATTARSRDMNKLSMSPRDAAVKILESEGAAARCGVLFGREAWGLDNDALALSDALVQVPVNEDFSSLNLAQAVLIVSYEWFQATRKAPPPKVSVSKNTRPANKEELLGLFEHLESELDACGFLRVKEKRPSMVRNLRNMLQRTGLTEQEVRTLRGVIKGLVGGSNSLGKPDGDA